VQAGKIPIENINKFKNLLNSNASNEILKKEQRHLFKKPLSDIELMRNNIILPNPKVIEKHPELNSHDALTKKSIAFRKNKVNKIIRQKRKEAYDKNEWYPPASDWRTKTNFKNNDNISFEHGGSEYRIKSLLGIEPKNKFIESGKLANNIENGLQIHTHNNANTEELKDYIPKESKYYAEKATHSSNNINPFDRPAILKGDIPAKYLREQPDRKDIEAGIPTNHFDKIKNTTIKTVN
jgi:hypothetical protein